MKKAVVLLAALALLAGGGFFAYRAYVAKPEIQVLETARVEVGTIRGVLVETGIVKPQVGALVKIGARATGTIVQMKVKIGDPVKEGEVVALIDDRELRQQIQQASAALDAARNTLAQVEATFPKRISEAKANRDFAKITLEREQNLIKKDFTTKTSVDKAKSEADATEARLLTLKREYETQLPIARANVADRAAALAQAETKLSYTRIVAPITGVVSEVTGQEGETIVAGLQVANLVTVLDPTRLEMWIYVDETDIGRVKVGQQLEYYVDTFPDKVFRGSIDRLYPQPVVKDNIVYYLAIAEVNPRDAALLRPEMTTHVRIAFAQRENVLAAPNGAVKFERGRQVAYAVVGGGRVKKLDITIGLRGEDRTEITSGVKDGDVLATKLILPVASPENGNGGGKK